MVSCRRNPPRSARPPADIAQLREAIWGAPQPGLARLQNQPGRRTLLSAAREAHARSNSSRCWPATPAFIRRSKCSKAGPITGCMCCIGSKQAGMCSLSPTKITSARPARSASASPPKGDPSAGMRCATKSPPCLSRATGNQVELALTLEPNESVLLVFQPDKRAPARAPRPLARQPPHTFPIVRDAVAQPAEPKLERRSPPASCSKAAPGFGIPEGNPAQSAPAGHSLLPQTNQPPGRRKITRAVFTGTADNSLHPLHQWPGRRARAMTAAKAGGTRWNWTSSHLRPGPNQLAISAVNATDQPSPAGLLGCPAR